MKYQIFEHFVPIVWEPGHMGAFLANFLTPKSIYPIPLSIQAGILTNKEWFFQDAFDNFFGRNYNYDDILKELSINYSGVELIEMVAINVIDNKYKSITKGSGIELTFEILKNNSSRYIKEHPNQNRPYQFDDIIWKNKKIYCRFPYSKLWIPYFLLKYKFGPSDPEFKEITKSCFQYYENQYPDLRPLRNEDNYINFNIYDLIFNKNLDQVYIIDPNFEFNDDKKCMLDLAHDSSLEILESFGLNYNWSMDSNTKNKDVLAQQKKSPEDFIGRVESSKHRIVNETQRRLFFP